MNKIFNTLDECAVYFGKKVKNDRFVPKELRDVLDIKGTPWWWKYYGNISQFITKGSISKPKEYNDFSALTIAAIEQVRQALIDGEYCFPLGYDCEYSYEGMGCCFIHANFIYLSGIPGQMDMFTLLNSKEDN